ncbi:MAG: serine--tRNA ligase, partial [Chlamydiae bacterium]|nr:serine--tRNA ligase [Chlamydiota bacterium]
MLDIKLIRKEPEFVQKRLRLKDPKIDLAPLLQADKEWQEITPKLENLRAEKNRLAKEVGLKKGKNEDSSSEIERMSAIKTQESELSKHQAALEEKVRNLLSEYPNLPFSEV